MFKPTVGFTLKPVLGLIVEKQTYPFVFAVSGGIDSIIDIIKTKAFWKFGQCITINHQTRYETVSEHRVLRCINISRTLFLNVYETNSQTKLS